MSKRKNDTCVICRIESFLESNPKTTTEYNCFRDRKNDILKNSFVEFEKYVNKFTLYLNRTLMRNEQFRRDANVHEEITNKMSEKHVFHTSAIIPIQIKNVMKMNKNIKDYLKDKKFFVTGGGDDNEKTINPDSLKFIMTSTDIQTKLISSLEKNLSNKKNV